MISLFARIEAMNSPQYWLLKSEPSSYSIDDLKRDTKIYKSMAWEGVRNYQARNFMQQMKNGDFAFFYHSGSNEKGVFGVAKITAAAHPDESQFKKGGYHFDPKATREKPIWYCVDVSFVKKFKEPVLLGAIKSDSELNGIMVAARGSRLSVQPVSQKHFEHIVAESERSNLNSI
jgi:predicted RNA-binding protein with PUA-like domain